MRAWRAAALALCVALPTAAAPPSDPTLAAMQDEIARSMAQLRLPGMPAPYLVSATVTDEDSVDIEASLGTIVLHRRDRSRHLETEVRVGDAALDSSSFMSDQSGAPVEYDSVPIEPAYGPLRRDLWLAADRAYKNATARYEAKRAQRESEAGSSTKPASRSKRGAVVALGSAAAALPDDAAWLALCKQLSRTFRAHAGVYDSHVELQAVSSTRTLVTSEGTRIREPQVLLRLEIVARTQADDGMPLVHHATFSARRFDGLPAEKQLQAAAERVARELEALRVAPLVADYAGPILFEGLAAPELMRALFAEELSGTPLPETSFGGAVGDRSALESRVGWRVLPLGFDVFDDPALANIDGTPLIGRYTHDDEGTPAQRVDVIKDGTLLAMLMSRAPSERFKTSNGHGRAGASSTARGLAANLVVRSRRGVAPAALRARLLAEARAQGLDHGLVIRQLDDPGVTGTTLATAGTSGGVILPAPVLMFEIDLRGHERLVRGGRVESLSTRDLRHVLAAGRDVTVYSYFASAVASRNVYSGDVPTSVAAPDLLVGDADVRRPTEPSPKPPVLPRPAADSTRAQPVRSSRPSSSPMRRASSALAGHAARTSRLRMFVPSGSANMPRRNICAPSRIA